MGQRTEADWVSHFADEVIAAQKRRGADKPIVCASGLSPSGPIHLGNLREVLTPHFVADEIRRRGLECRHIVSWDDYDRFRKVPAGIDPSWSEHIGKPLSSVPAPAGSSYSTWAEHFTAPLLEALDELGVETEGISQTDKYTSGAYREQVLLAMSERRRIDAILEKYRTKKTEDNSDSPPAREYFPYKPFCTYCNRDFTTITSYDDVTTDMTYDCECGHSETVQLAEFNQGKLGWKVDWPMRWAYEGVTFEPSGVDHQSSSFAVGGQIVSEIFGGEQPIGPMYAFVGISGMAKMSSSRGQVPTPADALEIMEPSLVRWLYSRRRPNQSFNVAFGQETQRLYDEWDAFERKVSSGSVTPAEQLTYDRAVSTHRGKLPATARPLPYRTLASIADITTGNDQQTLRIVRDLDAENPIESLDQVRPRLDCARHWVTTYVSEQQRTIVRTTPDAERLAELSDYEQESLRLLLAGLDDHWSLEGLTKLVYGVPKAQLGLPADAKPTQELKTVQREFFALLYTLLVGRNTGPRLPTLLLAIGADRVRELCAPSA